MKVPISEFKEGYLSLENPTNTKIGKNVKLKYCTEELTLQTGSCKILKINGGTFYIEPDIQTRETMFLIQEKMERNSDTAFVPFISEHLLIKISKDTKTYNKQKKRITNSELEPGDIIIFLLETEGLWSNYVSSTLAWRAKQIMKLS